VKTVRVRLWRPSPPFLKSVTVGQITVAGFMELLRLLVSKASDVYVAAGKDLTAEDLIRALREPEFNALADSVCQNEEAGFFHRWLSLRNVRAIYAASFRVNDWSRIFSCVDWTAGKAKKKRKGSLVNDIQVISQLYHTDPMTIHAWPMEFFLAFVAAMNLQAEADEPEPLPTAILGMVPGVSVVH
jgi:hypothetical protein